LEEFNNQFYIVNSTIHNNIIEGTDKEIMMKMIRETNDHTQNYTGKLSKAFLEHYEKYKNILSKDRLTYEDNVKELEKESKLMIDEESELTKNKNEYDTAINILENLKKTYAESQIEAEYFDKVVIIIKKLFKNKRKLKTFVDGPVDGKCATTLLRTHIKNENI